MSRPDFSSRPPEWKGLGHCAGPDFSWPSVPAGPASASSGPPPNRSSLHRRQPPDDVPDPAIPLSEVVQRRRAARVRERRPTPRPGAADRLRRSVRALGLFLVVFFLIAAVLTQLNGGDRRTDPRPTTTRTPLPASLPAVWAQQASGLRPDLGAGGELLDSLDGSFDDNRLVSVGGTWAMLTGDAEDRRIAVHGLDATTGRARWRTDLANGLCAADALKSRLVCAASVATDPATGLGTRWRILLLDPATGSEVRGADFTGWLTLIHVDGDRIMLVEQRQPAPHAVLTGLDAELRQRWQLDFRDEQQHAGLFSDDRIVYRKLPIPDGPALDRPRIRKVAGGLTALWSGQTTAFVDLRSGKLVGMPRCSRLVDDGKRLWCNAGAVAVAYSYTLRKLYETALNTRLAFPYRDPRAGDVTDPVFLESNGGAVRVDLANGTTLGPLAPTRNGSAFGLTLSPQASFVGGLTLLSDSTLLFAVDARTGKLRWQQRKQGSLRAVWAWHGKLVFTDSLVRVVDPADGRELASYRQGHGLNTVLVGSRLVGIGPAEIALLADP